MPLDNTRRGAKQRLSASYKKIELDIRRKIGRGIWQVGSQIPSRQQLARDYGVDLSTIQRAVSTLLTDGVVASDGTRGTYVNRLPAEDAAQADAPGQNGDPGFMRTDWEAPRIPAPPPIQATAKKIVGVAGRFAPDISELLVPYILAQALENSVSGTPNISLKFFDTFCDRGHSTPISDGAVKLLTEGVHCLCVIYPDPVDVTPIMLAAHKAGTPVVFITSQQIMQPVIQVHIDQRYDGYQAAKYLIDMGYRELRFVQFGTVSWSVQRLEGIRAALAYAGLPASALTLAPPDLYGSHARTFDEFREPLRKWVQNQVKQGELRGGIIAANDHIALEIMDVAQSEGVLPNQGFSLISFDDRPEARRRGLTTMRPPLYEMGREASKMIMMLLDKQEMRGQSIAAAMVSQVVERSTTL